MSELRIPAGIIPDPKDDPGFYPEGLDADILEAVLSCSIEIDPENVRTDVTFTEEVLERLDGYDPRKLCQIIGHTILNAHGAEKEHSPHKYAPVVLVLSALGRLYEQPPKQAQLIPKPRHPFVQVPTEQLAGGRKHTRRVATKRF